MGSIMTRPSGDIDRETLFRFFGIHSANEQDDNTKPMPVTAKLVELLANQKESTTKDTGNQQNAAASERLNPYVLKNPGVIDEMHDHCKDMRPKHFEGLRMYVGRSMSETVSTGHLLHMGKKSFYQFSTSYTSEKVSEITGHPLTKLSGEFDPNGNSHATVVHFFLPRLRTQLKAQIMNSKLEFLVVNNDYLGDNFTCSLILNSIDLHKRQGIVVASYLQQVLPSLALGVEWIYQCEDECPEGSATEISAVASYKKNNKHWTGAVSANALEACYSHCFSESLCASIHFHANVLNRQAITRLCYQCSIPHGMFTVRGCIDTRFVVCAVCEKRLQPLPLTLAVSGRLNHISKVFKFGISLSLE